jgi:hypothetical protein
VVSIILSLPFQWLISIAAGYGAGTLINRAGGRNGGVLAIAVSVVATIAPFFFWLADDIVAGNVGLGLIPMALAAVAAGLANRRF